MRYSDNVMVRSCDIVFAPTYVKICLEKRTTDVYRKCCPVKKKMYMHQAGFVAETSAEFLIRAITSFSKQKIPKLRVRNTPL